MISERKTTSRRYDLSFTAGALLVRESMMIIPLWLEFCDWERVRQAAVEGNVLQTRTRSTGVRLIRETVQRLSTFSNRELDFLAEATGTERAHLLWIAVCRRYELIGDFAESVLREKYLLLASSLAYNDFDSFIRSSSVWHEELVAIKESTLAKLRSNVFKMLKEAELISKDGVILATVLSNQLVNALAPSDLRFFPVRLHDGLGGDK